MNELPNASDLLALQASLVRIRAGCRLHVKRGARGRWERVATSFAAFETALNSALELRATVHEVAIFLDHPTHGGIMIWSSSAPDVINAFEGV